jgi:hypothetical protein
MIDRRTINGFPVHYVAAALLQAGRRRGPGKSPLLPIATNDEAVDRDPALACAIPVMPYSMHSLHTLDELKQRESWLKASVDAMIGLLHRYVCMEQLENACFFCLLSNIGGVKATSQSYLSACVSRSRPGCARNMLIC